MPLCCQFGRRLGRACEAFGIGDHVIRGHEHQHRIAAMLLSHQRGCHGGGRRRIASDGLQHDGRLLLAHLLQLLGNNEAVIIPANHHRWLHALERLTARHGGLQHGLVPDQLEKLLGEQAARHGPQAGTGTTGQQDGNNHEASLSTLFGGTASSGRRSKGPIIARPGAIIGASPCKSPRSA